MSNFNKPKGSLLKYTKIIPANKSHIKIKNRDKCLDDCENKPCTYICPALVFSWTEKEIKTEYTRCMECLACPWSCPYNNIDWTCPPGGYGVKHEI